MKSIYVEMDEHGGRAWAVFKELEKVPGGYVYSGAASYQICFPLKDGGELRFMIGDDNCNNSFEINLYSGEIPPGVTGPAWKTGEKNNKNEDAGVDRESQS